MPIKTIVKTSEYHDSVSLMLVGRELASIVGVHDAAVMMGTEANKSLLAEAVSFSSRVSSKETVL